MESEAVKIYTDGSCSPNPGPGGWGAVLLFAEGKRIVELSGQEDESTNNRMELMAALKALQSMDDSSEVEVFTDSRYLQQGVTAWLDSWRKNGWLTRDGQPVKNRDLWDSLSIELERLTIRWKWVKGHSENTWNNRADELAVSVRTAGRKENYHIKDPFGVQIYLGVTWKHSSGSGAWAAILCYREHVKIIGGDADSTNNTTANKLYLIAAIESIQILKRRLPVQIYTKSGYFRDGMENWLSGWQKRGWRTKEDREISNKTQWQELALLQERFSPAVMLVSGEEPLCKIQEAKELAREFEKPQQ